MFRKVLVVPVLLVTLAGCGSSSNDTATTGAAASGAVATPATSPAMSPAQSSATCPTKSTKRLAKTRFVADAGLAFGAFHRWIWKPYKAGTFKSGADGRTKSIVKAAAAGAFALNRLNAGRKLINADPTLCKALKQPVEALWNQVSGLTDKLKSGGFDGSSVESAQKAVEDLKSKASDAGANISDKNVPVPGT